MMNEEEEAEYKKEYWGFKQPKTEGDSTKLIYDENAALKKCITASYERYKSTKLMRQYTCVSEELK